jgi:hypothetical protein
LPSRTGWYPSERSSSMPSVLLANEYLAADGQRISDSGAFT